MNTRDWHILWLLGPTEVYPQTILTWDPIYKTKHRWSDNQKHTASSSVFGRGIKRDSVCTVLVLTHTHPFNGPFSGTTRVSRYQKGKKIWILLKQETVSGSSISWAISASRSRQVTTPASHHSVFYRPDVLYCTVLVQHKQL